MPVPTHFRFTVRGTFQNSEETWSYGTHFTRANPGEADAGLDDINESTVATVVSAFHSSSLFTAGAILQDFRFYVIGTDGKMEGNAPMRHEFPANTYRGSAGSLRYPPQIALAITTAGANRGPARFGRFYLPGINSSMQTDWRLSVADATAIAETCTQYLKDISDAIDLEVLNQSAACNVSTGPVASTTGTLQEVDHLEVGRVFDTLRNRRKSLLEERHVHGHIDW
jgi:hypothetical protein